MNLNDLFNVESDVVLDEAVLEELEDFLNDVIPDFFASQGLPDLDDTTKEGMVLLCTRAFISGAVYGQQNQTIAVQMTPQAISEFIAHLMNRNEAAE